MYLPYIRPIFQAYVREYPRQHLHFRILKFPLIGGWATPQKNMKVSFPLSRYLPKSRMAMQEASLACFLHQLCTPSTLHIIFSQLGSLFLYGKIKFIFQTTNQKCIKHQGFHKWGYPNSWMVAFMENPNLKWFEMDDLGILPFMESLKYIQLFETRLNHPLSSQVWLIRHLWLS